MYSSKIETLIIRTLLTVICPVSDCPVNCTWEPDVWSDCIADCDGVSATRAGNRKRTFKKGIVEVNQGICTQQPTEQIATCTKTNCPVNCVVNWNNWNNWSSCNVTCNDDLFNFNSSKGNISRTRYYNSIKTPVANGGIVCPIQPLTETSICFCAIDSRYAGRINSYFYRKDKKMFGVGENSYMQFYYTIL